MVQIGSAALKRAAEIATAKQRPAAKQRLASVSVLNIARATIFRHFVAGEEMADVQDACKTLSKFGVRCIVDHSTEELAEEHLRQRNLEAKLQLLQSLSTELGPACSFVPVKATGLISPALLERLTDGIVLAADEKDLESVADAAAAVQLNAAEEAELASASDRLRGLCEGAQAAGIPLLLDAEQTHRQPAIRLFARALAAEFNTTAGGAPILYDTHQAYLRGAEDRIARELAHARANGYTLAVKLVRGAYRAAESERDASVLQPSKACTDEAYDRCAELLLDAAVGPSGGAHASTTSGSAALLLATHNRTSALKIANALHARAALDHPCVHFAQIQGMADDLTLSLGIGGFNAHKLVPFGAFHEVLPWLLRRLEENQDALGAAATERPLLRAELARRFSIND